MMKPIVKSILLITSCALFVACGKEETAQPKVSNIVDAVFASGKVVLDHEYIVTANAEGYLIKRFVEVGATVEAEMPLFQLSNRVQSEQVANAEVLYQDALEKAAANSPQREQLKLQVEQSRLQLELDKKNYERYKRLFESNAVSEMELDQKKLQYENAESGVRINQKALDDLVNSLNIGVENAKTQLVIQQESNADYFLTSRIDGKVLQTYKQEGDLVRRGEVVALIGGGQLLAKLFVSEEDINEIALNQLVVLNLNTDQGQTYEGVISKIYPSFDQVEQSFIVEATFVDLPALLYHNTQLQANIIIGEREGTLVIPSAYLVHGDSVKLKNGSVRSVQVGIRNEQWVEIVAGVNQSDVLRKPKVL